MKELFPHAYVAKKRRSPPAPVVPDNPRSARAPQSTTSRSQSAHRASSPGRVKPERADQSPSSSPPPRTPSPRAMHRQAAQRDGAASSASIADPVLTVKQRPARLASPPRTSYEPRQQPEAGLPMQPSQKWLQGRGSEVPLLLSRLSQLPLALRLVLLLKLGPDKRPRSIQRSGSQNLRHLVTSL